MARTSIYIGLCWLCWCFGLISCSPNKKSNTEKQSPATSPEIPQWQPPAAVWPHEPSSLRGINRVLQKMIIGDSVRIVCWGNSITYGFAPTYPEQKYLPYPQELQRAWQKRYRNPFIEVINLGHPGWRSEQALAHIEEVLQLHPDLCFIHFGINDAVSNYPFSWYAHNLEQMAGRLQQAGIEPVFLTPTPILQYAPERVAAYAQQLPAWCAGRGLLCIDVHHAFQEHLKREKLTLHQVLLDGIHPDAPYYRWIADAVFDWWLNLPLLTDK
ncbi:SGNH/GDSL hydrolase family protein [Thermonema rossianum]|uniref:SGNH/GDSL hydrolase family protein n=1 Tax=Thermonema rossianum TaxID=55505 RepID=UPI000A06B576|nr:SGNH/GDSL hydrolase family protein [Thermonema rossianum]